MGVDISIMLACRITDNENSNLLRLVKNLCDTAKDISRVELLIKFDDDDPAVSNVLQSLEEFKDSLSIKHIITPRGLGYFDLHKAYNDLLLHIDTNSSAFWVLSDDVTINNSNWDEIIIDESKCFNDGIWVLHSARVNHTSVVDAIERPEPYPVWSRQWIFTQGTVGHTFSTDGWTAMLEYVLYKEYGIDRRIFTNKLKIDRRIIPIDCPGSERYEGDRNNMIKLMLSNGAQSLLSSVVDNMARALSSTPEKLEEVRRDWHRNKPRQREMKAYEKAVIWLMAVKTFIALSLNGLKRRFFGLLNRKK